MVVTSTLIASCNKAEGFQLAQLYKPRAVGPARVRRENNRTGAHDVPFFSRCTVATEKKSENVYWVVLRHFCQGKPKANNTVRIYVKSDGAAGVLECWLCARKHGARHTKTWAGGGRVDPLGVPIRLRVPKWDRLLLMETDLDPHLTPRLPPRWKEYVGLGRTHRSPLNIHSTLLISKLETHSTAPLSVSIVYFTVRYTRNTDRTRVVMTIVYGSECLCVKCSNIYMCVPVACAIYCLPHDSRVVTAPRW